MAVDIAPRNASGAALGVVGIASYIGAGLPTRLSKNELPELLWSRLNFQR